MKSMALGGRRPGLNPGFAPVLLGDLGQVKVAVPPSFPRWLDGLPTNSRLVDQRGGFRGRA